MTDLTWDDRTGRFRDTATGRFVTDAQVRAVVDSIADAASARMATAAEALLDGRMSLGSFQVEMGRVLKDAHLATATIAHGGAEQMGFSEFGSAGQQIRVQYDYLKSFAEDIASGRQPLNRTIVSRAEMYGQSARVTFENERSRGQAGRGNLSCRNVLHAQESCGSCRGQSAMGWVPIGSLIPVGQRTCLSRCRCTVSYRQAPAEVQAA